MAADTSVALAITLSAVLSYATAAAVKSASTAVIIPLSSLTDCMNLPAPPLISALRPLIAAILSFFSCSIAALFTPSACVARAVSSVID